MITNICHPSLCVAVDAARNLGLTRFVSAVYKYGKWTIKVTK